MEIQLTCLETHTDELVDELVQVQDVIQRGPDLHQICYGDFYGDF